MCPDGAALAAEPDVVLVKDVGEAVTDGSNDVGATVVDDCGCNCNCDCLRCCNCG